MHENRLIPARSAERRYRFWLNRRFHLALAVPIRGGKPARRTLRAQSRDDAADQCRASTVDGGPDARCA
jgi:hypothetical protein